MKVLNGTIQVADSELNDFEVQLKDAIDKMASFNRIIDALDCNELTEEVMDQFPHLEEAARENAKLEYRAQILRQSVAEQQKLNGKRTKSEKGTGGGGGKDANKYAKEGPPKKMQKENEKESEKNAKTKEEKINYVEVDNYGSSLLYMLRALFAEAVQKAYEQIDDLQVVITEATQQKFGDYQFNSTMAISQKLKLLGQKVPPQEVAQKILQSLPEREIVEKTEIAGPGYINIFLRKSTVGAKIADIAMKGFSIPQVKKRRVVVDFSSPNVAKQMHVGHLRSTIIGDSICRLMEFVGFDVARINHIGDWGTQFGMLIAHLQDRFPNFLNDLPPIADLQAFYKESKQRFDEDAAFKARAYECVVKLQGGDADSVRAWQLICDVSRRDFQRIYERLDIKIVERGESFYQSRMIQIVEELERAHLLELDDGRKIMRVYDGDSVPLTVVKSDGGFTYDTSDLATLKYRLNEEHADWAIYVVDAGQSLHLNTIHAAGRKLNWYTPKDKRIEHVSFGVVLGEDRKKFKTRSGDTVRLTDLLDEGVKRAAAKLLEKERELVMTPQELEAARDAVAYGCIKYADLSQNRTQDYVFSFDRMLDDRGNTAVYLLYAYARIRSICRNTGVAESDVRRYIEALANNILPLEHPAEFRLAKSILKFSDCLLLALDTFMLHQLCEYVYSVATTFHDFYNECYVINKDAQGKTTLHYNRLVLCQVTADVMSSCFQILGIRTVEKM